MTVFTITYNGMELAVEADAIEVTFATVTHVVVGEAAVGEGGEAAQESKANQVRVRAMTHEEYLTPPPAPGGQP